MVTDVQLPIIGADFLANFNLLVDYRNQTLEQGHVPIDISANSIHMVTEDRQLLSGRRKTPRRISRSHAQLGSPAGGAP